MPKTYNLRKRKANVQYRDELESSESPPPRSAKRSSRSNTNNDDDDEERNTVTADTAGPNVPKARSSRTKINRLHQSEESITPKTTIAAAFNGSATQNQPSGSENNSVPQNNSNDTMPATAATTGQLDNQLEDVLNALLELHQLNSEEEEEIPRADTFEGSTEAITQAINLNRKLQYEAVHQIAWIKQRILQNEALMRQCRMLSMKETLNQDSRLEVHKKYKSKVNFFCDDEGKMPPMPSSSSSNTQANISDDLEFEKKSWSTSERKRLLSGIHLEAQRALVLDLVAKKNEHKIWDIDKMDNATLENVEVDKLDWKRISSIHVKTRTPMQCMIQWTTQEHPSINKKPWFKAESRKLTELVEQHGFEGQWEKIAVELETNRTASQCFSHYQSIGNSLNLKRKWTDEDDEALTQAVEMLGERNWQQVAFILGNRTGNQCLQRWAKCISPAIRRQRWTKEEDDALRGAVEFYGAGIWNKVQRHVPGRTDMQCRERWMNILDPKLNFSRFSKEEISKLMEMVGKHGKRWSFLTQFFPGRTDNHLYRAWATATKKKKKKSKDGTLTPEVPTQSTTATT